MICRLDTLGHVIQTEVRSAGLICSSSSSRALIAELGEEPVGVDDQGMDDGNGPDEADTDLGVGQLHPTIPSPRSSTTTSRTVLVTKCTLATRGPAPLNVRMGTGRFPLPPGH